MDNKTINKRAIILVALVVIALAASAIAIIITRSNAGNQERIAKLYRNNELIETIDLDKVTEPYQLRIEYGDGNDYNIVEVRNGSIGVVEASCPDLLCKNVGFISNSLMPITCLPNHLVIKVESKGKTKKDGVEIDAKTY